MSNYRRHFPRAANPPVVLQLPSDQGPVRVPVRDLSAGGARVSVSSTIPVGAELDVRLEAPSSPDGEPMSLRARVLRIQPTGSEVDLAVEFVDRVEGASSRLQTLIESMRSMRTGVRPTPAASTEVEGPVASRPPAPVPSQVPAQAASPVARPREAERLRRDLAQAHEEVSVQVERGDRAEAELQALRLELSEERERRLAAERTLVTLQSELSRARSERGELERLRALAEEAAEGVAADAAGSHQGESATESATEGARGSASGAVDLPASADGRRDGSAASGRRVLMPSDPARERALLGPEQVGSRVVFARHLREGARLRPTERFARFEPVSRLDVRVHEYAQRADQLSEIRRLAARRVSEEEILRVLFTFFERGLLRLEPRGTETSTGSGVAS